MSTTEARAAEIAKYKAAYSQVRKRYAMNRLRLQDATNYLRDIRWRKSQSLLDVGCGRGELMSAAKVMGMSYVRGTETVDDLIGLEVVYALAHELPFPDRSFDIVSCTDVIEHILPGDDELAVREMCRVAKYHVIISVNNGPSVNERGDNLHVNIRPFGEWESLFNRWAPAGSEVKYLGAPAQMRQLKRGKFRPYQVSPAWRIDL